MRVRVNNGGNWQYSITSHIEPIVTSSKLIVCIDPSKTNSGFLVGDVYGNELEMHEFSGTGMDTSYFCQELRKYIVELLQGCDIYEFVQEEVILKKEEAHDEDKKKHKDGVMFFESMKVLTEIRAILIDTAFILTGKPSIEVNNMDWKGDILPDGYRGHKEKGSVRFLTEENVKYEGLTDDLTDVVCIYRSRILKYNSKHKIMCTLKEQPRAEIEIFIIDESYIKDTASTSTVFEMNYNFNCEDNAIYFSNRSSNVGICSLDIAKVKKEDLYKYALGLYPNSLPYLAIVRKAG